MNVSQLRLSKSDFNVRLHTIFTNDYNNKRSQACVISLISLISVIYLSTIREMDIPISINSNCDFSTFFSVKSILLLSFHMFTLCLLFLFLSIISSDFLLANLTFISTEMFRISPKIAGMTLLALGNSSPDLCSTFFAFNSNKISMALGELLGSGFLCTSFIIGLMGIINEFSVVSNRKKKQNSISDYEFLFDLLIFSLFLTISIFFINDGILRIEECIIMVILYCVYIGVSIYIYGKTTVETSLDDSIIEECAGSAINSIMDDQTISHQEQFPVIHTEAHQHFLRPQVSITIEEESDSKKDLALVESQLPVKIRQQIQKKSFSDSSLPTKANIVSSEQNYDQDSNKIKTLAAGESGITYLHPNYKSLYNKQIKGYDNIPPNNQAISNPHLPLLHKSASSSQASLFLTSLKTSKEHNNGLNKKHVPFGLPYYLMGSNSLLLPSPTNFGASSTFHENNSNDNFAGNSCMNNSTDGSFYKLPTNVKMSFIDLFELDNHNDNNRNAIHTDKCQKYIGDDNNDTGVNEYQNSEQRAHSQRQCLSIDYGNIDAISVNSINDMASSFCSENVCDVHMDETLFDILFPFSKAWNCTPDNTSERDFYNDGNRSAQVYIVFSKWCANIVIILNIVPFFLIRLTTPRISDFQTLLCDCEANNIDNYKSWKSYKQLLSLQSFMLPWLFFIFTDQPITSAVHLLVTLCISICFYQIVKHILLKEHDESTTPLLHASSKGENFKYISNLKLFRKIIAVTGFINSMIWISFIASLVIGVLSKVGTILNISESLLGLTLFAIGNSIGDIITNLTFAKLDLAMIGIGSCFGSPLLYILFGIGFNGMLVILKNYFILGHNKLYLTFQVSSSLQYCVMGLILVQVFYAISIPLNKWVIDKRIGIVGVIIWVLVTSFNIIRESFFTS